VKRYFFIDTDVVQFTAYWTLLV